MRRYHGWPLWEGYHHARCGKKFDKSAPEEWQRGWKMYHRRRG